MRRPSSRRSALLTTTTLAAGLVALAPTPAEACGGTFCDAGPQVMPVDQSGENILFWVDDSQAGQYFTEAHIQIQYEGDAERFAWIIPVMAVPEVLVGNQALFDNLLAATVPTFTLQTRSEACAESNVGICLAFAGDDSIDLASGFTSFGDDEIGDETGGNDNPDILDRGFAGAFEYVTLTGDNIDEIVDWLEQNGYAQDDEAPPILDEYLQEGFVFVAVKLRGGAGVDEIHPLAIRYPGVEPCIPIRLTRIAAVDDMAIRAFFLGGKRVVPQNWPHVELNPAAFPWTNNPALGYQQAVSLAIDEAGGRAFVTEYAGIDDIVPTGGLIDNRWNAAAFAELEPTQVWDEILAQGLYVGCDEWGGPCGFTHPQIQALLEQYLPPPANLDPIEFWSCVTCYEDLVDLDAWSAAGLAAAFEERITGPAQHAIEMLTTSSYLTRLYTLLSPHEMLEDPFFHETSSLPPVDNDWSATRVFACEGNDYVELPDGRIVALENGNWPSLAELPRAEKIEKVPAMGPAQVETDNGEAIDELLDEHNRDSTQGPQPWNCSIARLRPEALLTFLALFGIAWLHRSRRPG